MGRCAAREKDFGTSRSAAHNPLVIAHLAELGHEKYPPIVTPPIFQKITSRLIKGLRRIHPGSKFDADSHLATPSLLVERYSAPPEVSRSTAFAAFPVGAKLFRRIRSTPVIMRTSLATARRSRSRGMPPRIVRGQGSAATPCDLMFAIERTLWPQPQESNSRHDSLKPRAVGRLGFFL
jgi:hypothetical protein